MKRVYAVTGAFGHLGNTVVRALLKRGERVRALALPGESCKALESRDPQQLEIVRGDIRSRSDMRYFLRKEQEELYVIHGAGIVTIASRVEPAVYDVNVNGTRNVMETAAECGAKSFVYVSSVHALPGQEGMRVIRECRSPEEFSPDRVEGGYAKTKAIATRLVLEAAQSGFPARVVHPSGILGPWDQGGNHLMEMARAYLNGKLPLCVRGGYDFVDVRDVAQGCIAAADRGRPGECYILSNRHYEIAEVLRMLGEISGRSRRSLPLPLRLASLGVPFSEWQARRKHRKPLFTGYSLRVLRSNDKFSHGKASLELGYAPRDLYDTLQDTVRWLRASGEIGMKKGLSLERG